MTRHRPILAAVLLAVFLLVPATASATSPSGRTILEFEVMAPVTEPFTGTANPIDGIPGGGLPWEIDRAIGELDSNGRLEVTVEGLVLARRAPVPAERQGTNPVPSFKAIVSCQTATDGVASIANISTETRPATPTGNAHIEETVDLPSPCLAPTIFVTSPDGAWFAVTGQ